MRFAGVGQPEDQQRPVPEIQRIGHRAEGHQRPGGQQPVGQRQPATGFRACVQVRPGQDQQDRGAHRNQCPRAGELFDAVDQRAAGQDGDQSDTRQQRAQPHRPADERDQRPDQDAQQQFPGPREAVVVGGHLVGVVGDHRVDERGDGQHGQHRDEGRAQPPAQQAAQNDGQSQGQQQERDVELALHRHRPDVLQRGYRLAGAAGNSTLSPPTPSSGSSRGWPGSGRRTSPNGSAVAPARSAPPRRPAPRSAPAAADGRAAEIRGPGLSEDPGVSTLRNSELPKKNPDSARKTSTPPDTRPNQTWNIATSAIATPRRPSRSWRYSAVAAGTCAAVAGQDPGSSRPVAGSASRLP